MSLVILMMFDLNFLCLCVYLSSDPLYGGTILV